MNDNVYGTYYNTYVEDILKKPDEEFKSEGKYYHYTSLENCINMLEMKDGCFEIWASHIAYLNDKEEHINGLDLIERKVQDLLLSKGDTLSDWIEDYREARIIGGSIKNDIFVICFCSDRSLLSQWKYYGKNSGIAIEYNIDKCEYSGHIAGIENIQSEQAKFIKNYPHKVIYDNISKQKIIDKFIIENIYNIYDAEMDTVEKKRIIYRNMDRLYSFAPLFKHDSFDEEKESRLLFMPIYMPFSADASNLINYRVSGGKIIPYMKIKIKGQQEGNICEPVVKSLTIGPGENQDLNFEALKHFVMTKFPKSENNFEMLTRKDYSYIKVNGIEIRKALTPFRG